MAKFAKLNINNKVEAVYYVPDDKITDINGNQQDDFGIQFLNSSLGFHPRWVRTYPKCEKRKNYAGIGFTYDIVRDAFIPPKPYNSWTLNEETCQWEPPVIYPTDGQHYNWNEETISWEINPQ